MNRLLRVVCYLVVLTLAVPVCGQKAPLNGAQADCVQAVYGEKWNNKSFAPQRGIFTAEFDVTPSLTGSRSALIISEGATAGKSNGPIFILFDRDQNLIRIRQTNGTTNPTTGRPLVYRADKEIKYVAGARNHFRVVADVPKQTFSVYVTTPERAEQALAVDYPFEKTVSPVAALNNIAIDVQGDIPQPAGTKNAVCNLVVRAAK